MFPVSLDNIMWVHHSEMRLMPTTVCSDTVLSQALSRALLVDHRVVMIPVQRIRDSFENITFLVIALGAVSYYLD